jgi:hypothetical protein
MFSFFRCVVCLEDMKGDCARDNLGRPIIVNFGIPWGSDVFMQRQVRAFATHPVFWGGYWHVLVEGLTYACVMFLCPHTPHIVAFMA